MTIVLASAIKRQYNHWMRHLRSVILTIILGLYSVISTSCGRQIDDVKRQAHEEIEGVKRSFAEQIDKLVVAFPGGEWNRLLHDLNGEDDGKRKAAQQFLKRVAQLDVETPLEVSVWFGFQPSTALVADAWSAGTPDRSNVQTHFALRAANMTEVGNKLTVPLTEQEITQMVDEHLRGAADLIGGKLAALRSAPLFDTTRTTAGVDLQGVYWFSELMPLPGVDLDPQLNGTYKPGRAVLTDESAASLRQTSEAARQRLVKHLKEAFVAQYKKKVLPAEVSDLPVDWNLASEKQFLFVAIREDDWKRHRNDKDLRIECLLHEKGHRDKPFHSRPYRFPLSDFEQANEPVDTNIREIGRVVWAFYDVTASLQSQADLERIHDLRGLQEKWRKEEQTHGTR
jgi:hypothetical protein